MHLQQPSRTSLLLLLLALHLVADEGMRSSRTRALLVMEAAFVLIFSSVFSRMNGMCGLSWCGKSLVV